MEQLRMGIMGTGNIARTMAETIKQMENVKLCAVASRTLKKAEDFAKEYGFERAYGTYEELAEDKETELIYIATPHSEHCANAILCLNQGKHVLCEKAFAVNEAEAVNMIKLAKEKQLLITEAMWVRYMPMVQTLKKVIASGKIGAPYTLTANLGYLIDHVERMNNPALAGGALLDVGVYTLTFASVAFGDDLEKVDSTVIKKETGVDAQNSITLTYKDGKMAILNSSMRVLSDRQGIIYGTKGFIVVENINNFESIRVYDENRNMIEEHLRPKQISGYEYQVDACQKAIRNHQTECMEMPHEETIFIMGLMDQLRSQWGLRYPMEQRK